MYKYRITMWIKNNKYDMGKLIEERVFIIESSCQATAIAEMDDILRYLKLYDCSHMKKVEKL